MRFSVQTTDGTTIYYNGTYTVDDGGVLTIVQSDESKPIIFLSPQFWQQVEVDRPKAPSEGF